MQMIACRSGKTLTSKGVSVFCVRRHEYQRLHTESGRNGKRYAGNVWGDLEIHLSGLRNGRQII